jgi:hypothetical protein
MELSSNSTYPNSDLKDFQTSADVKSKIDPAFGKRIAEAIVNTCSGVASYYYLRNARFKKNRDIANGQMDIDTMFRDRLEMNGKQNYINILFKSIMIGNTIISRLVGRWMIRNEKAKATAIDPASVGLKKTAQDDAEYILHNKELLAQLQQASGVPMVGADQFIPEDKDALDMWVTEFQRLPEEIKNELKVNNIIESNGFTTTQKNKCLHDSAQVGLVGTEVWMDNQGVIHIDRLQPENIIYSYSLYDDFRDTSWRGVKVAMKISQLRDIYGVENGGTLTEEKIWELAQFAKEYQFIDKLSWTNQWLISIIRPYDDWSIDIIRFYLKSYDNDTYLITETKQNKSTIIKKTDKGTTKISDNQKLVKKDKWNMYKCVYATDAHYLIEWELQKNMIRPQDPKEIGEVEFPISLYMYQNNDMRNLAVPEKIEEPIEQMILARLKMQQLVANMIPSGAAINTDALQEIDYGLGDANKDIDYQKLYQQTGKLYYRGRDAEGNPLPVPITELANAGFIQQMQGLIEDYQFHYQVLRDEVGINEAAEGQTLKPRTAVGVAQQQVETSYNATDYMYDAFLRVMEDTSKKVMCLLRLSVIGEADAYREIKKEEVANRVYSIKVEMLPDNEEIAALQQMINGALAANAELWAYIDPFKIMRIAKENIKLAEAYWVAGQKAYITQKQQQQSQNIQETAKAQAMSAKSKTDGDAQLKQLEGSIEMQKQQLISDTQNKNVVLTGVFGMLSKGLDTIPAYLQPLVQATIQNIAVPLVVENEQQKQAIVAQMQQQQMQAQQAQMQQQNPQEEGMEQGMQQNPQEEQMEQQPQQQTAA